MSASDDETTLDLNKMRIADLKKELQLRNLKVSGNKHELIQRLQKYLVEHEGIEVEEDDESLLEIENEDNRMLSPKTTDQSDASLLETEVKVDEAEIKTVQSQKENKDDESLKKVVQLSDASKVSEPEKKELRAKKFGLKVEDMSQSTKLEMRQQRFGIQGKSSSGENVVIDAEKLKKRAERFGTVVSTILSSSEQQEKMMKRKERFGDSTSETDSKKQKRMERFGAPAFDNDSKKQKRAERFGLKVV